MKIAALFLSVLSISAAPWPQFRGPNATGIAADAHPPRTFSRTNNLVWKSDVPYSPSSPVVWGDLIFLTTVDKKQLQLRAYNRKDGEVAWARGFGAPMLEEFNESEGSPAASTPATDGQHVVAYYGSIGLVCTDFKGRQLWYEPLPLAETSGGFGTGTSPIIVSNKVILNRDLRANSSIMAFDVATGKKLWETLRPGAITSYSTPVVWRDQIVVAGSITIKAYDLKTGAEKWLLNGTPAASCTTPAVTDDMLYFAGWSPGKSDSPFPSWETIRKKFDKNDDGKIAGDEFADEAVWFKGQDIDHDGAITQKDWDYLLGMIKKGDNALLAIKPGGSGDITQTHVAWRFDRGLPYVPSPLYYEGRLYMIKDGGMLSCFDAKTGQPIYTQERINAQGNYYSAPVAADGRIFLASQNGKVTIIKAGGEKPEILHQADFGEKIPATPALIDNNIYLRTQSSLYAFGATKN
jgi:outer membrane protein assembly factor BamB